MVVVKNKIDDDKNTRQTLAISKAMHIRWCDMGRIAQWSASVASCKATRCRHWESVSTPYRPGGCHGQQFLKE
jgi:hypothetical protein